MANCCTLLKDERSRGRISMRAFGDEDLIDETSASALGMDAGRAQR